MGIRKDELHSILNHPDLPVPESENHQSVQKVIGGIAHFRPSAPLPNPDHATQLVLVGICQNPEPISSYSGHEALDLSGLGKGRIEDVPLDFGKMVTVPSNLCKNTALQFCPINSGNSSRSRIT